MAEKIVATMYAGEAVTLDFTLRQDTDISSWTLKWRLYDPADNTQLVEHTLADNITVTSNTTGDRSWTVDLDTGDTSGLLGSYPQEMIRDDSGSETVLAIGPLIVKEDQSFAA